MKKNLTNRVLLTAIFAGLLSGSFGWAAGPPEEVPCGQKSRGLYRAIHHPAPVGEAAFNSGDSISLDSDKHRLLESGTDESVVPKGDPNARIALPDAG